MSAADWNTIFWKYIRKGHDRSSAAYEADKASVQKPSCTSTHCERAQECRSPHECSGSFT